MRKIKIYENFKLILINEDIAHCVMCLYLIIFVFNDSLQNSFIPRLHLILGIIGIAIIKIEKILWRKIRKNDLFNLEYIIKGKIKLISVRLINAILILSKYMFTISGTLVGIGIYIKNVEETGYISIMNLISILIVFLFSFKRLYNYLSKM